MKPIPALDAAWMHGDADLRVFPLPDSTDRLYTDSLRAAFIRVELVWVEQHNAPSFVDDLRAKVRDMAAEYGSGLVFVSPASHRRLPEVLAGRPGYLDQHYCYAAFAPRAKPVHVVPSTVTVKIDGRTLNERTIRYILARAARGPASLVGGSLVGNHPAH